MEKILSSKTLISFQLKKERRGHHILDDIGVSKLSAKVFILFFYFYFF